MANGLAINREQFNEIYPDLEGHFDFFNNPPPSDMAKEDFENTYFKSKLWRLNNMYSIINKDGEPCIFKMNYAQHKVYAATKQHPRIIILKSRQQGISTLWLVSFTDDALWCPYLRLGLMAQGTDEATTLFERVKFLWDNLSPDVKQFLNIRLTKDNTKELSFSNDSTMFIRVSFRSATLQRLHISEFGKIANANPQRAKETKTGTLQALARGNTGVIESTAEGRNEFKFMWDAAEAAHTSGQMAPKDFLPVFLPWYMDPDCVLDVYQSNTQESDRYLGELEAECKIKLAQEQRNFWIAQYRELGGDIYQEYPGTPDEAFRASRDGTYYARLYNEFIIRKKRLVTGLYDPNLPVEVFFDLGVDDYTCLIVTQWYRGEYRIIGEYFNNGYDLTHYVTKVIEMDIPVDDWYFPHDIAVRELMATGNGGRAKSREQLLREHFKREGISGRIRKIKRGKLEDGIEAVRAIIKVMWIDAKCEYIRECLLNYSKDWDPKLQVWRNHPLHNEFSHGADCLRQLAQHTIESNRLHRSKMESGTTTRTPSGYAV